MGNICFLSPLVLSKWEDLAFSVCMLFEESVFIFQFSNNKMHNYVLFHTFVHFIIQKLKNKHTFFKKYANWAKLSSLILTEREETKTRYFAPWRFNRWRKHVRKPTRAVGANQIGQNSLYLWEEQVEKRYSFSLRSTQPINN